MNNYKIHILMGLPGSGKTYFANSFNKNVVAVINLDSAHGYWSTERVQSMFRMYSYHKNFVIDGLVLTTEDLKELIAIIKQVLKDNKATIIIHHWKENREACINNDNYRIKHDRYRKTSSKITIDNAELDSINKIKTFVSETYHSYAELNFEFEEHEVYVMDNIDSILNKYASQDDDGQTVIESESWCNGGTWCNCWGNTGTVEADTAPEFELFDNILVELCPNITFLQYKKLFNACAWVHTYNEYDYYGGSTSNSVYKCNVKKLKETLQEMNLI